MSHASCTQSAIRVRHTPSLAHLMAVSLRQVGKFSQGVLPKIWTISSKKCSMRFNCWLARRTRQHLIVGNFTLRSERAIEVEYLALLSDRPTKLQVLRCAATCNLQEISKRLFPGWVKSGKKVAFCLSFAGKKLQCFHDIFCNLG